MNIRPIREWTLYRLRYIVAYGALAIITVGLLILYAGSIPPGLGPNEAQSVVTSSNITFTQLPTDIINLPYHALQKLSVDLLGVTPFGVRLPSLVFGALTALCLALILRRWFTTKIAIAATLLVITSSWFLGLARLGDPSVMVALWTSLLLLAATYVSQQTPAWKWWRVVFFMAAAISIYTPLMAYLFIAAAIASLAQPHLRFLLRESNRVNLFIGGFFFVLLLVPLGWGIYQNPSIAWQLLGVPATLPDPLQFGRDLLQAASNIINPYNTAISGAVFPLLSLVSTLLLIAGGARLLRDFHSVRAHFLLIWGALLIPIIGLNPNSLAILFVPAMLVVAIGFNQLVQYWYKLFPFNPYARLLGLAALTILLLSIVQINYERYMYSMLYSAHTGVTFTPDAFLAQQKASQAKEANLTIVVPQSQLPLYQAIASRQQNVVVAPGNQVPDRQGIWLVAESEARRLAKTIKSQPIELLVTDRRDDSLRFRVYER